MSVREEFEAWYSLGINEPGRTSYFSIWQAAYRAGALAMRERAAKACEQTGKAFEHKQCVAVIRALDVDV